MMPAVVLYAALSFLLGLLLQGWASASEARLLRAAARLLRPAASEEGSIDPAGVTTLLQRTRMALSAVRVGRAAALALLVPGSLLLARAWPWRRVLPITEDSPRAIAVLVEVTGFLLLISLILLINAWTERRAARSDNERVGQPQWLADSDVHLPMHLMVGAAVWERTFAVLGLLPAWLGFHRPSAQLYEQDERLHLRLAGQNGETNQPAVPQPRRERSDRTEAQMIRAIQRLDRTLVREIMRPINQVTAIRLRDYTSRRLLELCRQTGFTRIPCYTDQITNLIGFINVYDVLESESQPRDLRPFLSEALFVPEVARVDVVLETMIAARQQAAIVFDEFGGTSGWLSREDILEEIVGDVGDEYERPRPMIVESRGSYLVDPSADLDDLGEELGLELPKRHCDTLAGYVYARLGRVPRRGESIEEKGWTIRVAAMAGHRIRRLRLIPPPHDEENED